MPVNRQNRFLLLYGSQTGQAKAIAEEIAEKAGDNNLHADIHCLSLTEKKFYIEREKCVVIVTSTTGDGEPPDTALKFIRRLKKKTLPGNYLSHLNYALLGLGDSNYTNFCNCAKSLDKRLQDLGAKRFYDCGWADDAVGLEVAVEPWMDGLWAAIQRQLYGSYTDMADHTREVIKFNKEPELSAPFEHQDKSLEQNGFGGINSLTSVLDRPNNSDFSATQLSEPVDNSSTENVQHVNVTKTEHSENICDSLNTVSGEKVMEKALSSVTDKLGSVALSDQSDALGPLIAVENELPGLKIDTQSNDSPVTINQSCQPMENGTDLSSDNSGDVSKIPPEIVGKSEKTSSTETKVEIFSVSSDVPNIRQSVPLLSESNLSVPVLSPAYLKIEYDSSLQWNIPELPLQNGCQFPSAASPVAMATVMSAVTMTTQDALKKTMMVQLDVSECNINYEPGDSFSLICPNDSDEVELLLRRLGLSDTADTVYQISVLPDTKKKNPAIPKHVPEKGTLKHLFTTCLDIREPPKKALLRVLVEHTCDSGEQRRLQGLCSRQGSDDYATFIREPSLSLLDILNHFRSCSPPIERLIEHLPRLQPRPYSICSSPLVSPGSIEFVFNVVEMDLSHGRTYSRRGVCTGWIDKFEATQHSSRDIKVPVFARTSQHFRLPSDISTPVIMVGPGTGVAPFLGFLRHRAALSETGQGQLGEAWLFYGCRHRDRDYLYRDELQEYLKTGNLTQLCVCFSRDKQPAESPRYVQENIRAHGAELVKLIVEKEAIVYVCGDAKNMAKDVNQAFIDIFATVKGLSEEDARKRMIELRLKKRYLEDVWT